VDGLWDRPEGEEAMARQRLFTRETYIRLNEAETGFFYTVKYGPLSLPPRRVRILEESANTLDVEVRSIKSAYRGPYPVRPAPGSGA
jgi:hypothetical protein